MKFLDVFTWRDVEKLVRAAVSSKHVLQEYITSIEEQRNTSHFRAADSSNRQAIPQCNLLNVRMQSGAVVQR